MRKMTSMTLVLLLTACLVCGCSATAEELTGEAQGYGGRLTVLVSMSGDRITEVQVTEHHETEGVGTKAIETLPSAIAAANSVVVDDVSGATVTSRAIKQAVAMAIGQSNDRAEPEERTLLAGVGLCATGRVGPGKDADGTPIYSINIVAAGATFDPDGRIIDLAIDQVETATPNYEGVNMPEFSGFPGQGGYARYDDQDKTVSGKTADTEERFLAEVAGWRTKGMRGDSYMMPAGSWRTQMDVYERLFIGMTVDEVENWFSIHCSDETGRPLTPNGGSEGDQEKYAALSGEAQELLTEITSSATISLRDVHGDVITAIRRAWEDASRADNML